MGKIVSLPPRHTVDEIFDEVRQVRANLEAMQEQLDRFVAQPQPERTWLTIEEAAALLHRTPQAIRFRCRRGLGVKIAGKWRISREQLFSQN